MLVVGAPAASAHRPPTAGERAAIIKAWSGPDGFPARCLQIQVSTVNDSWAGLTRLANPAGYCTDHNFVFDGGYFLRRHGASWKTVLGASDAQGACARAGISKAVRGDLAIFAGAAGCSRTVTSLTFQSPSGNIVCRIAKSAKVAGGGIAACLVKSSQKGAIVQGGRGLPLGSGTITNPSGRVLGYISSIGLGGFQCESMEAGMTCKNSATGHGFFASRESMRYF